MNRIKVIIYGTESEIGTGWIDLIMSYKWRIGYPLLVIHSDL